MFLSFRTDRSGQTEEQSDQGLYFLLFHLHHFDKIPFKVWPVRLNFWYIIAKISGIPKFRNFTVVLGGWENSTAFFPVLMNKNVSSSIFYNILGAGCSNETDVVS